jgi:threonine dehydratase
VIGLRDIEAAASLLRGVVRRTPLLNSPLLDRIVNGRLLFKAECLQRGGAFKLRGAYNKISAHLREAKARGVIAYSSGNHGIATALAASLLSCPATIVMPEDAAKAKVRQVDAHGARIVYAGFSSDDRKARAEAMADSEGLVLVPPYDDDLIMAGQGTCAVEILEEAPETDMILAPVGGGGLLAGVATAAKAIKPEVKVIGCEAALADDAYRSFRAGKIVKIDRPATIADGMRNLCLAERTFEIIKKAVDDIVLVSEEEIASAMRDVILHLKVIAEPTGAVAPAAALFRKVDLEGKTAVTVISGGNVDPEILAKILQP